MARGGGGYGHSPAPSIPKASFTKVDKDDASTQPCGVHDQQARSYGFNNFDNFVRPEHYIRYIEPLESDLAKQVEYDMDEQDKEWLDAINNERRVEQLNKVTYETFEIIMDRLEKEWFDLTKNIPKPDFALPSEDSTCAICDDAEGENANAIVFCDGCNLAVHQDCYGVPYIPEGQWLCRKCTISPENPVSCILCPNEGGAFKQTVSGDWAHLLCAIWVPETRVANETLMEPITGVEKINKQRWKLKCSLCGIREGACIQCSKTSCFLAFHTTCARREKLLMPMKATQGQEPATLACYCEKHLPKEQLALHEAALAELEESGYDTVTSISNQREVSKLGQKKARAYAKSYKLSAPLVPAVIVERIINYIGRINIRKKDVFLQLVCRYWSLKREARRGAPLLKRLHLEPWAVGAAGKIQTEEEMGIKLNYLLLLRKDLESVRMLAELVRKREKQKLKQAQILHDTISSVFFSHAIHLRQAFEKIVAMDRSEYFKNPVSRTQVPDYFDVIAKPICWRDIDNKLDQNAYWNLKDFQDDVYLVVDNAMLYNKRDTPIHRTASRIKNSCIPLFEELQQSIRPTPKDPSEADTVGDLEPSLQILEMLLSKEAVDGEEMPLDLAKTSANPADPLGMLFEFELGKLKPPPPPPPPKPKRDRKAEAERRRQRELDRAAGFRGPVAPPRTRRALAEVEAFVAGAGAGPSSVGTVADASMSVDGEGEAYGGSVSELGIVVENGEGEEDRSSSRSSSKRGTRWRREKVVLPGQADVPPVVDDVDSRRSFGMFDAGWILPETARRNRRAPIERQNLPPKKKAKTDRDHHSTLSVTTPIDDNLTLQDRIPVVERQSEEALLQAKREKSETIDLSEPMPQTYHGDDGQNGLHPLIPVDPLTAGESAEPPPETEIEPENEGDVTLSLILNGGETRIPEQIKEEPPSPSKARKRGVPKPRPISPIIIEELDTPATRREKHLARKLRKAAERAAAEATATSGIAGASASGITTGRSIAEPGGMGRVQGSGMDLTGHRANHERDMSLSTLSDLSDEEDGIDGSGGDEDAEGVPDDEDAEGETEDGSDRARSDGKVLVSAEDARRAAQAAGLGPATIVIKEGEVLEGGTLAWAKAETYPWWPSVVYEEDHQEVPEGVLRQKVNAPRGGFGPLLLVQFFDARKTWQWLPCDKIRLLGEDKDWDAIMLSGTNTKIQKFRTTKIKEQCRAAWRTAMAELETNTPERSGVGVSEITPVDEPDKVPKIES